MIWFDFQANNNKQRIIEQTLTTVRISNRPAQIFIRLLEIYLSAR